MKASVRIGGAGLWFAWVFRQYPADAPQELMRVLVWDESTRLWQGKPSKELQDGDWWLYSPGSPKESLGEKPTEVEV